MQAAPIAPPPPAAAGVFEYGYMTVRCTATLDGARLAVKQGIRKFEVPLASIRHLYVQSTGRGQFLTLYLGTEPSPGKKKVFRFLSNAGQPAFGALVSALLPYVPPGGDLRALDDKPALKAMGAVDLDKVVGLSVFGVIFVAVFIGLLPKLVHGLDFGQQKIAVDDLAEAKSLDSRNVIVTHARRLDGWTLAVTTVTKKNGVETGRSTKDYVPLVPKDWERGEPIRVILETKHDADLDQKAYPGIARTVMWEGLGSSQREFFEKKGIKVAKDVVVVEHLAEPSTDLWIFLGVHGGLLLLGGLLAWAVGRGKKKKA
jgi:hypothetical protein